MSETPIADLCREIDDIVELLFRTQDYIQQAKRKGGIMTLQNYDYAEKLKDPRWQKKRLEILNRDKWTCLNCGDTEKTLHVHHICYLPNIEPWESPNGLLITLCKDCHSSGLNDEIMEAVGFILDEIWTHREVYGGKNFWNILTNFHHITFRD